MGKATTLIALMLGAGLVAAAPVGDEKKAASAAPEKVLNDKGLTKDDRKFLLEEKPAIEKYEQARSAKDDYFKALKKYETIAQYDENVQNLEYERQELQQQVNMIQAQINSMGSGAGRMRQMVNAQQAPMRQQQNQGRAMITQINAQLQAAKGQAPKPDDRKRAVAAVQGSRQTLLDSLGALKETLDPILAQYHELALDKSVIDALAKMRHSTTLNYKLGPSDELAAAAKLVHEGKKHATVKSKSASKKKVKTKGS